tara:strand:+ start:98 stop:391 length:294 start_codon:yes stop_codon:yes gene_type:complete
MVWIFKLPVNAAAAVEILNRLIDLAVEVMHPTNRRRLGQRRNKLNSYYDQLYLKANTMANLEGPSSDWTAIAERCNEDRKILNDTKEAQTETDVRLY